VARECAADQRSTDEDDQRGIGEEAMKCKLCIEQGHPPNFGSPPRCAFESGEFSSDNWNCATAIRIRELMYQESFGELGLRLRMHDQSFGSLWVPPHPEDIPYGKRIGPWRGGGFISGYWYKDRGQTEMLIRVDPRDGGNEKEAALRLTLAEAEAAIENWDLYKLEPKR